jgi:hypothetical protein
MRVAVIGAGRWAAVYRRLLDGHEIVEATDSPAAVFVINKAEHHEGTALRFIQAGIPTLIEKPFALSVRGVQALEAAARDTKTYLAAAHVLKFAGYLEQFSAKIHGGRIRPHYCSITWTDPLHGRHYDPTLPLISDVLPHIVSIMDTLFPGSPPTLEGWTLYGAGNDFRFQAAYCCIDVHMERDADARRREISVACGPDIHTLDFTENATDENPLQKLIDAFLVGAGGGHKDERLDLRLAYLAAGLTEQCLRKVQK